jgi:hypothetical protein
MTMIRFNIAKDGTLKDDAQRENAVLNPKTEEEAIDAINSMVAANPGSELATSLRSLRTSAGAATNRALPASMFERGVRIVQGGTDHAFTRRIMEGSKPRPAKGFAAIKSGDWLK